MWTDSWRDEAVPGDIIPTPEPLYSTWDWLRSLKILKTQLRVDHNMKILFSKFDVIGHSSITIKLTSWKRQDDLSNIFWMEGM